MTRERVYKLVSEIQRIHNEDYKQTYADLVPYGQHLIWVHKVAVRFWHLIEKSHLEYTAAEVSVTAYGHDLLEDTNMTYNDLVKFLKDGGVGRPETVAEAIYNLTDEKGRTRAERKNDKYYEELAANPLAVYIKLCDIAANTMFSKLNGSDMYKKYKKEFPKFKEKTYMVVFQELFRYVEQL